MVMTCEYSGEWKVIASKIILTANKLLIEYPLDWQVFYAFSKSNTDIPSKYEAVGKSKYRKVSTN